MVIKFFEKYASRISDSQSFNVKDKLRVALRRKPRKRIWARE
jgi:hypothetical protein